MTDASDDILSDRASNYGDYEDMAIISQALKSTMRNTPNWHKLTPEQRESLDLIATKIARILNGDPNYADSWRDIAGYAELIVKDL